MKVSTNVLRSLVREYLHEIYRSSSRAQLPGTEDFISWAKKQADAITSDREKYGDLEFQWAEGSEDTKIMVYQPGAEVPIGYASIERFEDGHKVGVTTLVPSARGTGAGSKMYDYIISKTKLYSDSNQTPEARKLWVKLSGRYNVMGYDPNTGKTFPVKMGNNELVSADPELELYSDDESSSTRLVIDR